MTSLNCSFFLKELKQNYSEALKNKEKWHQKFNYFLNKYKKYKSNNDYEKIAKLSKMIVKLYSKVKMRSKDNEKKTKTIEKKKKKVSISKKVDKHLIENFSNGKRGWNDYKHRKDLKKGSFTE